VTGGPGRNAAVIMIGDLGGDFERLTHGRAATAAS